MTAMALLIVAVGCGGGSSDSSASNLTYDQVLSGLKRAALANTTYGAVRRAKALDAGERTAIGTFCFFAKVVIVDFETEKLAKPSYVIGRITTHAEQDASFASLDSTRAAVAKLLDKLDPATFDAPLIRHYSKACYL
jgi:hypothetical protein